MHCSDIFECHFYQLSEHQLSETMNPDEEKQLSREDSSLEENEFEHDTFLKHEIQHAFSKPKSRYLGLWLLISSLLNIILCFIALWAVKAPLKDPSQGLYCNNSPS